MKTRILLGVDTSFSPITRHAMRAVSGLIAASPAECSFIILTVVPLTQVVTMHPGFYVGQVETILPSPWHQQQAAEAQQAASLQLIQQGFASDAAEMVIRTGIPADEIVHAASEYAVQFIVLGSHGDSFPQRLRRLFGVSLTQQVQRMAPCPVLLVAPPRHEPVSMPHDLTIWYTSALQRYLQEHSQLAIFTPQQVAQQFAPQQKKVPGQKEQEAAILALEQLTASGQLCRHEVKGKVCYSND